MIASTIVKKIRIREFIVPILLSLYFVPIPVLGAWAAPFLLLLCLLTDPRLSVPLSELLIYIGFAFLILLMILIQPEKLSFLISLLLVVLISRMLELIARNWSLVPALWLHLGVALVSLLTLLSLGYDLLPMTIYGESRHGIHLNTFLTFRISGIYLEPSTMGLHMLLMSIWANHAHPEKRWVAMTYSAMALASFSSVTIIAAFKIALDLRHQLRSRSALLLIPVLVLAGGIFLQRFYLFFEDKLSLYRAQGLDGSRRFEALFVTRDMISRGEFNIMLGHEIEIIQRYVFYDLGAVISTPMILGVGGVLMVGAFLMRMRWSMINIAIVMATKATINNPLLWIATRRFPNA